MVKYHCHSAVKEKPAIFNLGAVEKNHTCSGVLLCHCYMHRQFAASLDDLSEDATPPAPGAVSDNVG